MAEKFEKCCKFKIELKGRRRRGQSFSPLTREGLTPVNMSQ